MGMEEYSARPRGFLEIVAWLVGLILLVLISISAPFFWVLVLTYLILSIKILPEYKRGVLFTLGRYSGIVGPGVVTIIPFVQKLRVVDLRIFTIDIPPQEVITKDNVSVQVNGVVFYRVVDPAKAVLKINDYVRATAALAQTVLRDVIGGVTLDELLENREVIADEIRKIVDEKTDEWGIDITEIRLQDITLPEGMKRAMAVQAEAERERRAIIIKSEGEKVAAQNYKEASEILASSPASLTLRVLQTLNDISKDPSQKFVLVVPIELLEGWMKLRSGKEE